jgi:hypothetical protein
MRLKLRSIVLLCALVALAVGATASAASASVKFEWKAGGERVTSGESHEVKLKNKSSEDGGTGLFRIDGAWDGSKIELTSSKVTFAPATKIIGGKPGTIEGRLVFENVSVAKPSKCAVDGGRIESALLRAEIVESAEVVHFVMKGTGKPLLLFQQWSGAKYAFFNLTFENNGGTCLFNGITFEDSGHLLAEPSPQLAEAKVGQLLWGTAATSGESDYLTSGGVEGGRSELSAGASSWTFLGEPEIELTNKQTFGAF